MMSIWVWYEIPTLKIRNSKSRQVKIPKVYITVKCISYQSPILTLSISRKNPEISCRGFGGFCAWRDFECRTLACRDFEFRDFGRHPQSKPKRKIYVGKFDYVIIRD